MLFITFHAQNIITPAFLCFIIRDSFRLRSWILGMLAESRYQMLDCEMLNREISSTTYCSLGNDDGYYAPGQHTLFQTVFKSDFNRSAGNTKTLIPRARSQTSGTHSYEKSDLSQVYFKPCRNHNTDHDNDVDFR